MKSTKKSKIINIDIDVPSEFLFVFEMPFIVFIFMLFCI